MIVSKSRGKKIRNVFFVTFLLLFTIFMVFIMPVNASPTPIYGKVVRSDNGNVDGAFVKVTNPSGDILTTFVGSTGGWNSGYWQVDAGDPGPNWPNDGTVTVFIKINGTYWYSEEETGTLNNITGLNMSTITLTDHSPSGGGDGGGPSGPSNNPPTADADGPYSDHANNSIVFDGSASNDTDGTISNYTWSFGDDSTGYGVTPTHTYTNQGNYTVTLTVEDNEGATDTDTTSATISEEPAGDNPVAVFTAPAQAVTNETISFFGSGSYDPDGTITNYTWTFDDGTISYGENPTHAYVLPDTYVVTLTVTDDDGKTDTALKTISIYPGESIDLDNGYLVDEDEDGEPDAFFNATTGEINSIQKQADGTFLIDSNDDGIWDYVYNPSNGQVSVYEAPKEDEGFPWWIIAIIIIVIILAIIGILFYTGIIYIEK